jgi:serine/threonine protein kinase
LALVASATEYFVREPPFETLSFLATFPVVPQDGQLHMSMMQSMYHHPSINLVATPGRPLDHSSTSSSDDSHTLDDATAKDNYSDTAAASVNRLQQNMQSSQACLEANQCVSMCEAYGRICPYSAKRAAEYACKHVRHLFKDSSLLDKHKRNNEELEFHHRLEEDDMKMGELLGTGGFCSVRACSIPCLANRLNESVATKTTYAVKTLRRQCMSDPSIFRHGAADLAVEAHFLQILQHEHIIQIHAVPKGALYDNIASGRAYGYFIVLDRLTETLDHRIEQWHLEQEKNQGNVLTRRTQEFRESKRLELHERLRVAYSIADAMEYLHGLRIIFRDLKPDNLGFTRDGVVKLFDFGLAKELKPNRANEDDLYVLSGNTGSRRYMAVEVAKGLPYNLAVDVYSFGILLWEMCSAEKPFLEYTCGKHMQQVVLGGERPPMDTKHTSFWPLELQWLMTRCWSEDPTQRPIFTIIKETIREILLDKKPETPTYITSIGERPRFQFGSPGSPNDSQAPLAHGIASLFHRKPLDSPQGGISSPTVPLSGTSPIVLPPTAAILSGIKPLSNLRSTNDNGRAKTWGFALRKKGT